MSASPRIALLCSGLGHIRRGHEVFARDLFDLLKPDLDVTLFKGGGEPAERELVIPNLPRNSPALAGVHALASPRWMAAAQEQERLRAEGESFAWGALPALLAGGYDIVHTLEREVCSALWVNRHLFARTPRILWSNGGAIPARHQPPCDAVQEHTAANLAQSQQGKAFLIPHGVDTRRFHPGVASDYRQRHGIPPDAFVVITVGSICYWHKRTDHVIREVAAVPGAWLLVVGQETADTPAIRALGEQLMPGRIVFDSLPHDELPQAYAAADVFTLGSLHETFGIVYIEAMAMGLPVVCTQHANQRQIVQQGEFLDMSRPGALSAVLAGRSRSQWKVLGAAGLEVVRQHYDLRVLTHRYYEAYARIAGLTPAPLPRWTPYRSLRMKAAHLIRRLLPGCG
ncbi:MAG: glycosyltransferase family 4 protein [Burkholderiaceae bacterium]|nr:glycosyltransferase family 4 protein [Rhodoferax sp.]MCP5286912.1 glycosyltransferase family 4 protein [Burkholderiaceae bacterium]